MIDIPVFMVMALTQIQYATLCNRTREEDGWCGVGCGCGCELMDAKHPVKCRNDVLVLKTFYRLMVYKIIN